MTKMENKNRAKFEEIYYTWNFFNQAAKITQLPESIKRAEEYSKKLSNYIKKYGVYEK